MKHLIAEIKVKYLPQKLNIKTKITSSKKAFEVLLENWDKDTIQFQESFKILLLNNSNEVLGVYTLSIGGYAFTSVDLRMMYGVILKSGATGFICCHNHPSGKLAASKADINVHMKIKKIASFHELNYLDNLIITHEDYYSFQDEAIF